ncbi:MAG: type II secretion system protein GspE [Gemmatimonadales bacterium]|nr:MAG: type II secretion system protein GspE [Gemmatimonadales bacterium]
MGLVPEHLARQALLLALRRDGDTLDIALGDPLDVVSLDHLRALTGCTLRVCLARPSEAREAIDNFYQQIRSSENLGEILDTIDLSATVAEEDVDLAALRQQVEDAPVVRLVNLMLAEAIDARASDIHVEPMRDRLTVRFRIDGALHEVMKPPKNLQMAIVSRIKVLADVDIAVRLLPQDGRLTVHLPDREVDIRVSTLPTAFGEKVVIRLFYKKAFTREKMVIRVLNFDDSKVELKKLGFNRATYDAWVKLIQAPHGIILVTGPTGSGKSTTLYACVKQVATPDVNIITMEDPVEINLPGISQGQINNPAGFTFAEGMRSILRQDPDIIMLGEMRDKETSEMAVQAALTGHLVFSTLHTNDSAEAYTRLVDIGVEPFLLAASIRGVLAQRLVRRICDKCKVQIEVPEEALRNIGIRPGTPLFQGKGCPACQNSGYKGRVGLFELLIPDEHINSMVYKRESAAAIKEYAVRTLKMPPLRRDGLEKALAGLTTLEDVLSAT